MRLPTFIANNKEPILQNWENFARSLASSAMAMDTAELRDHVGAMLDTIVADLDSAQTMGEQTAKSVGQGPRELSLIHI